MLLRVVASAGAVLFLAALSRAPYTPPGGGDAVLRLSWRMTVSAPESCRARTLEELEALPAHMRTPEVCTPDQASYALVVALDDAPADTLLLARGGVKGDRPLFVLEERSLAPGPHRIRLQLRRSLEGAEPEILAALDTLLAMEARRVRLVTMDGSGGLRVVGRDG